MIYTLIIYWAMGLQTDIVKTLLFMMSLVILVMCATSFGMFIGCVFKQVEAANAVAPLAMMPMILFGGFMYNVDDFPWWLGWMQYVSPIRYTLEMLLRNEFEDRDNLPV